MTPDITALVTDKEALAIDQDKDGKQGFRALADPAKNIEIWLKPLTGGEWAVCALNTSATAAEITVEWKRLWPMEGEFSVRDVWARKSAGDTAKPYKARVDSHDVMLFRLSPLKP
jgi:alpha-galactosidase